MKKLVVAFALLAVGGRPAFPCAPAPRDGDEIAIVEESAVIVWDAAAKTEHFIRRATFHGKEGRDFGFLVPTPAPPALAEANDAIFDRLEERTRRESVRATQTKVDFTPLLLAGWLARETATTGAAPPVEVLASQKVAGYDAVVLAATDAGALRTWLEDHGYEASEDLAQWLDAYVRKRWTITAFKIDASRPAARTSAVKMSFATERPFFPYREPASQRDADDPHARALNVWFLGAERVIGVVGENTFWPGQLRRSDPLPDPLRADVARLAGVALPPSPWMTAFLDNSSIRPGDDELYFVRSAVQSAFVQPPYVITTTEKVRLPLDVVALVLVIADIAAWRLIRRRA